MHACSCITFCKSSQASTLAALSKSSQLVFPPFFHDTLLVDVGAKLFDGEHSEMNHVTGVDLWIIEHRLRGFCAFSVLSDLPLERIIKDRLRWI